MHRARLRLNLACIGVFRQKSGTPMNMGGTRRRNLLTIANK